VTRIYVTCCILTTAAVALEVCSNHACLSSLPFSVTSEAMLFSPSILFLSVREPACKSQRVVLCVCRSSRHLPSTSMLDSSTRNGSSGASSQTSCTLAALVSFVTECCQSPSGAQAVSVHILELTAYHMPGQPSQAQACAWRAEYSETTAIVYVDRRKQE
jgi:hypothetical protein